MTNIRKGCDEYSNGVLCINVRIACDKCSNDVSHNTEVTIDTLHSNRSKMILIGPPQSQLTSFRDHLFEFVSSVPSWTDRAWRKAIQSILQDEYG